MIRITKSPTIVRNGGTACYLLRKEAALPYSARETETTTTASGFLCHRGNGKKNGLGAKLAKYCLLPLG